VSYLVDLLAVDFDSGDWPGDLGALAGELRERAAAFSAPGYEGGPALVSSVRFDPQRIGISAEWGPVAGLGFWRNPHDSDGKEQRGSQRVLGAVRAAEQGALTELSQKVACPFGRLSRFDDVSWADLYSFEEGLRRRVAYLLAHRATIAAGGWRPFWAQVAALASTEKLGEDAGDFSFAVNASWTLGALARAAALGRELPPPFAGVPLVHAAEKAEQLRQWAASSAPRRSAIEEVAVEGVLRELDDDARAQRYFAGQPRTFGTLAAVGHYSLPGDPPAPKDERHTLK
jgi:hypothetical protein